MKRRHLALWLVVSFIFSTPASSHAMESTLSHKWVCRPMEGFEFNSLPTTNSAVSMENSDTTQASTPTTIKIKASTSKKLAVSQTVKRSPSRQLSSARHRSPVLQRRISHPKVQLGAKAKHQPRPSSRYALKTSHHRKEIRLAKALDRRAKKHLRQVRLAWRYRSVAQTPSVSDHLATNAGYHQSQESKEQLANTTTWSGYLVQLHRQGLAHAQLDQPRLKAIKKTRRAKKTSPSLLATQSKASRPQPVNPVIIVNPAPIFGPVTQAQDSTTHRAINSVQNFGPPDSSLTPEHSPLAHGPLNDNHFTTLPLPDSVKIGKTYKDGYAWLKIFRHRRPIATKQVLFTGYNSEKRQTDSDPWITAKGYLCGIGVAACNGLPFGTVFRVIGNPELEGRVLINLDRKNSRYAGHWIDVWVESAAKALRITTPRGQLQTIQILATAEESQPYLKQMTRSYKVDQATLKSWTLQ